MIDANDWDGSIPTVGFDLDETLYQWGTRLNETMLYLDPKFPIIRNDERRDFDHLYGEGANMDVFYQAMNHERMYQSLEPYEGAIQAVKDTYDAGYNVVFVTTPYATNPTCAGNKIEQIRKDFGDEAVRHLILTHDKTIVNVDVLVDDKTEIRGRQSNPTWTRVVADHSWNRSVKTEYRLTDWSEWHSMLDKVMSARRNRITTGYAV